jgi:hypothetical protein
MERSRWSSGPESGPEHLSGGGVAPDAEPTIRIEPVRVVTLRVPPTPRRSEVVVRPPESAGQSRQRRRRRAPLAFRLGVVLLAVVAVSALAGFVALSSRPAWFAGLRDTSSPALALPTPHDASRSSTTVSPARSGSLSISAIVPSSGVSGQRVTILGSDLVGPGGYLVATFDGTPVPTSCPSEEQCNAVVPSRPPGASAIAVRLRTGTAVSNVVTFHYT